MRYRAARSWRRRHVASLVIQEWWRFHRARRHHEALVRRIRQSKATEITRMVRGALARRACARLRVKSLLSKRLSKLAKEERRRLRRERKKRLRAYGARLGIADGAESDEDNDVFSDVSSESSGISGASSTSSASSVDSSSRYVLRHVAKIIYKAYRAYRFRCCVLARCSRRAARRIQRWWCAVRYNITFKRHLFLHVRLRIHEHGLFLVEQARRKAVEDARWNAFLASHAVVCQRIWRFYRHQKLDDRRVWMSRARSSIAGVQVGRDRVWQLMLLQRKRRLEEKMRRAAIIIQKYWRRKAAYDEAALLWIAMDDAAIAIQSMWRMRLGQLRRDERQRYYDELDRQAAREAELATPSGARKALVERRQLEYNPDIHGKSKMAALRYRMATRLRAFQTYWRRRIEISRAAYNKKMRDLERRRRKKRVPTAENAAECRDDELQRGDIVSVQWRQGRVWWPAEILAVHHCSFISQFTGKLVGDELRTFCVRYTKDGILDQRVPFSRVRFIRRPHPDPPPIQPGSRGWEPPDKRLGEVVMTVDALKKHNAWERSVYARRKHQKAKLAVHRSAKTSLGLRSGAIEMEIVVGEAAVRDFRLRLERRREKLRRRGIGIDEVAIYHPCHKRDLRQRTRRDTGDKLPVFIYCKKGPALRHMVQLRVACRRKDGGEVCPARWIEKRSNYARDEEIPREERLTATAKVRPRARRPGPPSHWTRLPLITYARMHSVERPIADIKVSAYREGLGDPRAEEKRLFSLGYLRLPEDLVMMGCDPGTHIWVLFQEDTKSTEEKIIHRIGKIQRRSFRPSVSTRRVMKQLEGGASNDADRGGGGGGDGGGGGGAEGETGSRKSSVGDVGQAESAAAEPRPGRALSNSRTWDMVDQLALDDLDIREFHRIYSDIDSLKNGYIDIDDLVQYCGFDVADFPDFLAYYCSLFPAEDNLGYPLEERRLRDAIRFGDFLRIVGVFCLFGEKELVRLAFNYQDSERNGYLEPSQVYSILDAIYCGLPAKERLSLAVSIRKSIDAIAAHPNRLPEDPLWVRFKHFTRMCSSYPRFLLPLRKLQHHMSVKIMGVKFWRKKKYEMMSARRDIVKEMGLQRKRRTAQQSRGDVADGDSSDSENGEDELEENVDSDGDGDGDV